MKLTPIKVGDFYKTTYCGEVEIVKYNSHNSVLVKFSDGTMKLTASKEIRLGKLKNPMQPHVHGVGYFGIGKYKSRTFSGNSHEYEVWNSMLKRCYSSRSHEIRPTYKDCTVIEEWHNFQNFAAWYTSQKGYNERWALDKDLKIKGNREYSPRACSLLPVEVNGLFSGGGRSKRGENPLGVHWDNSKKKFISQISRVDRNCQEYLGAFDTKEEAFEKYKAAKELRVKIIAEKYKEVIHKDVYENLVSYTVLITD